MHVWPADHCFLSIVFVELSRNAVLPTCFAQLLCQLVFVLGGYFPQAIQTIGNKGWLDWEHDLGKARKLLALSETMPWPRHSFFTLGLRRDAARWCRTALFDPSSIPVTGRSDEAVEATKRVALVVTVSLGVTANKNSKSRKHCERV